MISRNIEQMKTEVAEHIAADAVIRETYWDDEIETPVGGAGCFIGCLTHSDDPAIVEVLFGLPEPSVKIAEHIFEDLKSDAEGVQFFKDVPEAIERDGKDLSKIHWLFLVDLLQNLPKQPDDIQKAIDPVIEGLQRLARGEDWSEDSVIVAIYAIYSAHVALAAARAADYSARSASAALCVADYSARAAFAAARAGANCAECADYVTYTAIRAADAAAVDAADDDIRAADYAAEIKRQGDVFLKLLREAE